MTTIPHPYIWVLNPDAERELAATHSYAVRAAFIQRIKERHALFDGLIQGEPFEYTHELSEKNERASALFWCPTPRALDAAKKSGLNSGPVPSVEVLRTVHDKRFPTQALSDVTLPGRCNIKSEKEWLHLRASTRGPLRLKRPFGYAGKGQRIWPEQGGEDRLWLSDSLRTGGFAAEPHRPEAPEYSQHGFVDARGILLGRACLLTTDSASAPVKIEQAKTLEDGLQQSLQQVTERAAEELFRAGYYGPFGIDMLVVDRVPCLIDLNPRFTLGWSIGMGSVRSEAIARALSCVPAETHAQADLIVHTTKTV